MRNILLVLLLTPLWGGGCNNANQPATNTTPEPSASSEDKDNTGINERDRSESAKTPFDQHENQKDIDITANIRDRVVDTKMSINAQNVKIITEGGKVTLRGPVKSAEEKQKIEEIAHAVAGAENVNSQLEIEQ